MERLDVKKDYEIELNEALNSSNPEELTKVILKIAEAKNEELREAFAEFSATNDAKILADRGIRNLTSTETEFYNAIIETIKTQDPTNAATGLEKGIPEEIVTSIFDEMKKQFPLLDEINMKETSLFTKMLVNKGEVSLAVWGTVSSAITKEISASIGELDVNSHKLSAFLPISQDMVQAGPSWVDSYARAVLVEAFGAGLEHGIINGTGKDMPIGMIKNVADDVTVTAGVYPDKTPITITDFGLKALGDILSKIAVSSNGEGRAISKLLIIANPIDYYAKIMPATTYLRADGTYAVDSFPLPTKIILSSRVAQGKAIFGLGKRYFLGVGLGGKSGALQFSDEAKFIEDQRTFKIKGLSNGRPLDNNAFQVVDISGVSSIATQSISADTKVK